MATVLTVSVPVHVCGPKYEELCGQITTDISVTSVAFCISAELKGEVDDDDDYYHYFQTSQEWVLKGDGVDDDNNLIIKII